MRRQSGQAVLCTSGFDHLLCSVFILLIRFLGRVHHHIHQLFSLQHVPQNDFWMYSIHVMKSGIESTSTCIHVTLVLTVVEMYI
ncbi:Immunoglobulin-like fold-containing protein [Dioscorea alata]|uniref:Immunoglobulin-like fold-containing protein n=1 Tax=Dioscorea alata TaxID=55571 RepID=A0ACB7UXX2_DIOAL|nr:Immunoglobulin-like fold-containing protein [Dioscorea alata]